MKDTKYIDTMLNDEYPTRFSLEYLKDSKGDTVGLITAPYVKWLSVDKNVIYNRQYNIKGNELDFIEKQFFDKNITTISVKEHPFPIYIEDILQKVIPLKVYKKLLNLCKITILLDFLSIL